METTAKKRKYSRLYCPHCQDYVSKSTWYSHHCSFFNAFSKQWVTASSLETNNVEETNEVIDIKKYFDYGSDFGSGSEDNAAEECPSDYFNDYNGQSPDRIFNSPQLELRNPVSLT